mmetsp:Transcript_25633/g.35551  ORF Transcript_25633/g.35551 Transcript_25633/m.35551 type:complete len:384 (-) Transcript_25633:444-1595(-)
MADPACGLNCHQPLSSSSHSPSRSPWGCPGPGSSLRGSGISAPDQWTASNFLSPVRVQTGEIFQLSALVSTIIFRICQEADAERFYLKKEDRTRLQFLKDTLDRLNNFISQQEEVVKRLTSYRTLLLILRTRLEDVLVILQKIERRESVITPNFDIFELKLRGLLEELSALFPLSAPLATPADVISDTDARVMWLRCFGADTYLVDFKNFLIVLNQQKILDDQDPNYHTQVLFLRYFINFPSDDVVTPYKWGVLMSLFGPFSAFSANFSKIVSGRGFLGLINRIQAYETLTLTHKPRTLLIRFSRTEPQFLAFSYKNSQGKIGHQINKDPETGLPVPIERFISMKFPNYELVNLTLNVEKIFENQSAKPLSDYAIESEGYIKS